MAILNVSSYITSAGLQAVTSAGQIGPYFAIKYFVPFYDPRIDASISRGNGVNTSALNISAMNLTSATAATLFGEKIYASSAANYSLSDAKFFYKQNGMNTLADGATGVLNSKQEVASNVNMLNGVPLSLCVSAASFSPSGTVGSFNLVNVKNSSVASYNPLASQPYPTSAFYRVQSYSPKEVGTTSASGSFKCRIPFGDGSFKFNGLALFVGKVDQYGYDTANTSPVLFAVVLMDKPQEKSKLVGGLNSYEIDVDLGFDWSSVGQGGNTPVYVETGYWTKVPTSSNTSAYALNYDGDVVISSSASPGSWMPQAKLTITDPSKAQVRLAYNNNDSFGDRYTDIRTKRMSQSSGLINPDGNNDRAVLSIDTSCDEDSLLELGRDNLAQSIKSIAMGISSSATYTKNGNYFIDNRNVQGFTLEHGLNLAYGSQALAMGDFNKALGLQTSAIGYNNFAVGERSFAGQSQVEYTPISNRGFNFAIGKNVKAISNTNPNSSISSYLNGSFDTSNQGYNFAFGKDSNAENGFSLAFGNGVSATGEYSVSIGSGIVNTSNFGVCFGYNLSAVGNFNYLFGLNNNVETSYNFLGGYQNEITTGYFNFVYGNKNNINTQYSTSFGYGNTLSQKFSLAIGDHNTNSGEYSFTFGKYSSATDYHAMAIGNECLASGQHSTSIGYKNKALGDYSFVAGFTNEIEGLGSYVLGWDNEGGSASNYIFGSSNIITNSGGDNFSIGSDNTNNSTKEHFNLLLGQQNKALTNSDYSIALGRLCEINHSSSMAIGFEAKTTMNDQVVIKAGSNITLEADTITFNGDMNKEADWRVWIEKDYIGSGNSTESEFQMNHKIKLSKISNTTATTKEISFQTKANPYTISNKVGFTDSETTTLGDMRYILIFLDVANFKIHIIYTEDTSVTKDGYVLIYKIETRTGLTEYYNFDRNVINYTFKAWNRNSNYSDVVIKSYSYFNGSSISNGTSYSLDTKNCTYKLYSYQQNYFDSSPFRCAALENRIYTPTNYNFSTISNDLDFYNLLSAGPSREKAIIYNNDVSIVE